MGRDRAFSAIIQDGKIVMVKHEHGQSSHWTLPGGGVENGEDIEETAVREAREEVKLEIKILRYLFSSDYSEGIEHCFLAVPNENCELELGYDPELINEKQVLTEAAWVEISKVQNDKQVSLVIQSLKAKELERFNINLQKDN